MNKTEDAFESTQPLAKRPYEKPVLTRLGALRDLTMTKSSGKVKDGKSNRFTGRGARYVTSERPS